MYRFPHPFVRIGYLLELPDDSISSNGCEGDELVSTAGVELSRSPWVRLGSFWFTSIAAHPTGLTVFARTLKGIKLDSPLIFLNLVKGESAHTMRYHFARYKRWYTLLDQ